MKPIDDIAKQFSALIRDRDELVAQLRQAADELEHGADVDGTSVKSALARYRDQFRELSEQVGLESGTTVDAISTRVSSMSTLQPARALLERVSAIHRTDGQSLPALDAIRVASSTLADRFSSVRQGGENEVEKAKAVLDGQHELGALLLLIENPQKLDDAEWGECVETVRQKLGHDVATALLRGRLSVGTKTENLDPFDVSETVRRGNLSSMEAAPTESNPVDSNSVHAETGG